MKKYAITYWLILALSRQFYPTLNKEVNNDLHTAGNLPISIIDLSHIFIDLTNTLGNGIGKPTILSPSNTY